MGILPAKIENLIHEKKGTLVLKRFKKIAHIRQLV